MIIPRNILDYRNWDTSLARSSGGPSNRPTDPGSLHGLLPHVQYDGFAAGDLNRLSGPARQNGPGERRHVVLSSPSDDPAMASLPRRGKLTVAYLGSPPRSPSPNHPRDVAGNPDASRCFVARDSDQPAPHGSPDRGGWPGSAARPRAGRRAAPSAHSLGRSKNLAAITVAADQHLSLAAHAQKHPGRRRRRGQQRTWTRSAMTGILPRHACSARCGARRRSETWPLRSAPCRPRQSARFSPRAKHVAQGLPLFIRNY